MDFIFYTDKNNRIVALYENDDENLVKHEVARKEVFGSRTDFDILCHTYKKDDDGMELSIHTSIPLLQEENNSLRDSFTNLELALVEQYETNLKLEQELENMQLAITEIYEGGAENG